MRDFPRTCFADCPFKDEDWSVVEVRSDLYPVIIRLSGNPDFVDYIARLPAMTMPGFGLPLTFCWSGLCQTPDQGQGQGQGGGHHQGSSRSSGRSPPRRRS